MISKSSGSLFLCLMLAAGCGPVGGPDGRVSAMARSEAPLVSKPGFVAVDHVERKKELERVGYLKPRCGGASRPVKTEIMPEISYGTDARYNPVSAYLRVAGAACFAGESDICQGIQEYARAWAESGGPGVPASWGGTLTANMRLLNPLISALAIAEANEPMSRTAREKVDTWLKQKVDEAAHGMRHEGYYEGRRHGITDGRYVRKAAHNHAVQSSLAAMSYGAWVGDDKYFQTGLEQWFITLDSMRADGSLPIETRRGAWALYYHGRTLSGLVQLAERARTQGINLYTQSPDSKKTTHKAVKFFLDAIENPELVLPYASANHSPKGNQDYRRQILGGLGSTMGWISPYARQFPDHLNVQRMKDFDQSASYLAGSLVRAVNSTGLSGEWIGVDAACFYSAVEP